MVTHVSHNTLTQEDSLELVDVSMYATPTQQQQITALVILGMIGAEFNTSDKTTPSQHRKSSKSSKRRGGDAHGSDDYSVIRIDNE